jgi:hypothetical protein
VFLGIGSLSVSGRVTVGQGLRSTDSSCEFRSRSLRNRRGIATEVQVAVVPNADPLAGRMGQVPRARRPELDSHPRKDSLRGQPHVSCRPTDPRRHPRGVGGPNHGNRALTGEYRDGQRHPAHRSDARLVPHLLHETSFINPACLAERLSESLDGGSSPPPGRCRRPTSRSRPCCGRRSWSTGSRRGSWRSSGR